MAPTYIPIASTTLTTSAASVTFSAIPQTYTDLVLRISIRDDYGFGASYYLLKLNSDTGSNYSRTRIFANGSTASSSNSSNDSSGILVVGVNDAGQTSNTFSNSEIYIPNYLVSANKPISAVGAVENNSSTAYLTAVAGLWRNTAAITSINIASTWSSNFLSGSSFFLYGIRAN